jgi:hypothetical protein
VLPTFSFVTGRRAISGGLNEGAQEHGANGGAAISFERVPLSA